MLKKLLKSLLGNNASSHHYRSYSSSDNHYKKRKHLPNEHGHPYYGSTHYKKKHTSHSFFSS